MDAIAEFTSLLPDASWPLCVVVILYGWWFARRLMKRIDKLERDVDGQSHAYRRFDPPDPDLT